MDRQRKAYIYALAAVLFWSTVASAFKVTLRYLSFIQMLLYSSLTSALILFIGLLLTRKLSLLRKCSLRDCLHSALLGFLNPFLYYLVLFKAYSILPAQEAQPLNFTWPVVLPLLSIPILGQKITVRNILSLLVSFSGVIVISTHGDITGMRFSDPLGAGLAVGSAFIWALFWLFNMRDKREENTKLFLNFLFGSCYTALFLFAVGDTAFPDLRGLSGAVYIGLFEMGITFMLWLRALNLSTTTSQVSSLIFVSPFLSLLFIHYIVGEDILASTIAGLILIVAGIIFQKRLPAPVTGENASF